MKEKMTQKREKTETEEENKGSVKGMEDEEEMNKKKRK